MVTSVQVSVDLLNSLKSRKLFPRETYEDVIRNLLEDSQRLSEKTRRELEASRAEIREGRHQTLEEVRRDLDA